MTIYDAKRIAELARRIKINGFWNAVCRHFEEELTNGPDFPCAQLAQEFVENLADEVPYLLDLVEAQYGKLSGEGVKCNSGHGPIPLQVWTCPVCADGMQKQLEWQPILTAPKGKKVRVAYISEMVVRSCRGPEGGKIETVKQYEFGIGVPLRSTPGWYRLAHFNKYGHRIDVKPTHWKMVDEAPVLLGQEVGA